MIDLIQKIDNSWTLFLDRDGVINYEKQNDYIHNWEEFKFYEGAEDAITTFSRIFRYVIIITNQKGVGKGLTKLEDLYQIHANLEHEIESRGGKIDAIYYCSEIDDDNHFRKPNPGMGLEAVKRFPDISLDRSIMIGNTLSDMKFGKNLGTYTIFLPTTRPEVNLQDPLIDYTCSSLAEFEKLLTAHKL